MTAPRRPPLRAATNTGTHTFMIKLPPYAIRRLI
jgi:hypothetical protein